MLEKTLSFSIIFTKFSQAYKNENFLVNTHVLSRQMVNKQLLYALCKYF